MWKYGRPLFWSVGGVDVELFVVSHIKIVTRKE